MAYELKKKDVIASNNMVFSAGYCELQFLLHFNSPIGFTYSKIYGWRADIYQLRNKIALSTGYATFGIPIPYEMCREYDDKARKIVHSSTGYDYQKKTLGKLLDEFIEKIIQYAKDNGF